MATVKAAYEQVMDEHRRRLTRLTQKRGVTQVKKLYDAAHAEMATKLSRTIGRNGDSFTSYNHRLVMAQLVDGQTHLASKMAGALTDASREAQVDTLRALGTDLTYLERLHGKSELVLPIEEASRFWGVINERKTSLMQEHEASMAQYGTRLVGSMEKQIGLGLATGQNNGQIIDRVLGVAKLEWWQGERIVRTEMAWASNATHADGLKECRSALPDLKQRWCEHCSDGSPPVPYDDRVGDDSIALHGQIVDPGAQFHMPPTTPGGKPVSKSLIGEKWAFPPNRPNDRAVLSPWRTGWGIPSWRWEGRRVPEI